MDRLETLPITSITYKNRVIYIPVWIDQKLYNMIHQLILQMYLYSSMDRLETKLYRKYLYKQQ